MLKLAAALVISAVASVAHSQQELDYNGNNMTGDIPGSNSGFINAEFQITGNTVNYDVQVLGEFDPDAVFSDTFAGVFCLKAQNCTPSSAPSQFFHFGLNNDAPPSFSVADTFFGNALVIANVGPGGDALSFIGEGRTPFSVSNNTPGAWTLNGSPLAAAPEIDASQSSGAITLLVGALVVLRSRQRIAVSPNR